MCSRAFSAAILTLLFLINVGQGLTQEDHGEIARRKNEDLFTFFEDKLEIQIGLIINSLTRYLADFNDKHLGVSQLGRYLHYDDIKPELESATGRSKQSTAGRMKKMAMTMMPLVFHLGATSTWMMLTSIMAAKSVMIGLALLIFKIAVSSAKLASFFTLLKGKRNDHHHGWYSPPHPEYHGHERSFSDIEYKTEYVDHPPSDHHSSDHHSSDLHYSDHHPSDHHPSDHLSSDHHSSDHHSSEHHPPSSDHSSPDWHSYMPEWTPNDISSDYHTLPSSYKHADIPLEAEKHEDYNGPYLRAEDRKRAIEKKKFV